MKEMSIEIQDYFHGINEKLKACYEIASKCREQGIDPEKKVDVSLAVDMAERVEGLVGVAIPQLKKGGVAIRLRELEKIHGILDWRVAMTIAYEVAKQKFCRFIDEREAMEGGIRVGLAYITLGLVSAPLEGFIGIELKGTCDGKKYVSVRYAGPIRAAGGTPAAVSVVIADYVRTKMGYAAYDPDDQEVKRYVVEVNDYHQCTNLQYKPADEEVAFLARNIPVEVSGNVTERVEVSSCKDLERVGTNGIRGGMCLVFAEGVALKAAKLYAKMSGWEDEFKLKSWGWLNEFLDVQRKMRAVEKGKEIEEKVEKLMPDLTFIREMVAGRPVLGFPLAHGAFRLRYGRARDSGYMACAVHPATMLLSESFVAIGTQLKLERPGKATVVTVCDQIDGPIVKLNRGDVVKVESLSEARNIKNDVKEIIYLGDILVSYGDFVEMGHKLVPAGYCEEWYVLELEKAIVGLFGVLDMEKAAKFSGVNVDMLRGLLNNCFMQIELGDAIKLSKELGVPLHPRYTFYWNAISRDEFLTLLHGLDEFEVTSNGKEDKIVLPSDKKIKRVIELLGVPHVLVNNEYVVIQGGDAGAFLVSFRYKKRFEINEMIKAVEDNPGMDVLGLLNLLSEVVVRDKGGTFIGARMGRPEKAKMRKYDGGIHTLFPFSRLVEKGASGEGQVYGESARMEVPVYRCKECEKDSIYSVCEKCGKKGKLLQYCKGCDKFMEGGNCEKHGEGVGYGPHSVDIKYYFEDAMKRYGIDVLPERVKGGRGLKSLTRVVEHFVKGVFRAKHEVFVNKDGTVRYDMTQVPITHFRPKEIGTNVGRLIELGYSRDAYGEPLVGDEQVLELKPQDIILPSNTMSGEEGAGEVLFRVANFVDELLEKVYGVPSYYKLESAKDLVGHLLINLAPHTSAGSVSRIIGFSKTQGMFCHPLAHAATRRNCDGDEAGVMLLMDTFLNFSRQYLPDRRGARTMDACLVLTSKLAPDEVDSEVHNLDIVWSYPLALYEGAQKFESAKSVKIKCIGDVLGTGESVEGMGFTHNTRNINAGVRCSAYKLLPSMKDKLEGQMNLAKKIRAVDARQVATLVIERHFLKDVRGNLKRFFRQSFRCKKCNKMYRRPLLMGKCFECGGDFMFTVNEGSIAKYLAPSIELATKYGVSDYLLQTLELLKSDVEAMFGKKLEKQGGLSKWVS